MTARGYSRRTDRVNRRIALSAGVALCALVVAGSPSMAQEQLGSLGATVDVPADAQLFLESDTVTYASDTGVVTADGGVRIDYGGYKLVAKRVIYNQKTRRLIAAGDVELVQPDGNKIYADSADITDDFGDGFITALRLETPENTRFAAQGAVRENSNVTTFEKGIYTACEACAEHPERAPLWQVKARKIVWDQKEKVIRYYGASFELFGAPIAYLPYFQSQDPTVKRKSGFLVPTYLSSDKLGYGLRVPYFFAIADDKDLTVTGSYYSKQGFLGEAEYRQAFSNGFVTLKAAGISQNAPDEFSTSSPDYEIERGMIGTTGEFALSDRWTFGWDILAQTDRNFSNTYDIEGFDKTYHTSEIYLTGLGDRSFFDLRGQRFDVQSTSQLSQDEQPTIYPSLDYQIINESPVAGGEVEINVNAMNLSRNDVDVRDSLICDPDFFRDGACRDGTTSTRFRRDIFDHSVLEGDYARGSIDGEWRRTLTTDQGLQLTPTLGLRGDVYRADMSVDNFPDNNSPVYDSGTNVNEAGFRGMATAGLEARYPVIIETENTSHIIEPIGQIFLRPDEMSAGLLPNEDAQSLVFDTSNLFENDKFSGYDRIEGGTRANVGLRYAGTFATGYTVDAMVGQSYHLFGENPYDQVDLALVGFDSGLETDVSDYVGSVALATPIGVRFGAQGRFDEETLEVRRTDLTAGYSNKKGSLSTTYSFIGAQETYGFIEDRNQVATRGTLKIADNWTAYGAVSYDVENASLISRSLGIGYLDECFSLLATYKRTESRYDTSNSQNAIMFKLGLRTISDFDYTYDLDEN